MLASLHLHILHLGLIHFVLSGKRKYEANNEALNLLGQLSFTFHVISDLMHA